MSLSVDGLLQYASTLEDERLTTIAGRAFFSVRVLPGGIEITPVSSAKARFVSRDEIKVVLDEYGRSRDLVPGHYQALSFHASYLLALIAHYVRERG